MPWSANRITTPVNSDDVVSGTGYNNHDWGHFCSSTNGNINKWSLWKPYRCAGLASPTNLQVVQMKFGIDVSSCVHSSLQSAINSTTTSLTPSLVSAVSNAYKYLPPTGGDASPYRITDYADDDDPNASANGVYFKRNYDPGACAPDSWRDWVVSEADLYSASKLTVNSAQGNVEWSYNGSGYKYQDCGIRMGNQSQETIGDTPTNAMPLTYLFGNNTIANEKWRIGLAVYLPNADADSNYSKWMLFAGLKPLSVANGGQCLPDMLSNIQLCKALYTNFKTYNVSEFTIVPCILCNSTLNFKSSDGKNYTTYVELLGSLSAKLLQAPTFAKCKLTITATPVPGRSRYYSDSSFRGYYSTNITTGIYKICVGKVTGTTNQTLNFDYYKVQISGTLRIEHDESGSYGATGNLKITASGSATYKKYASQSEYNSDKTGSLTGTSSTCANVAQWFYSYVGASAPSSVTPYLAVTKL